MKIVLIIIFSCSLSMFYSQGKSKYISDTLTVLGNCDMCENRIENNLDIVGIKAVSWDVDKQLLTVRYNPSKITLNEIHELCAKIGHATSLVKADAEAYENLHHCCKYIEHNHEEHDKHTK